MKGLSFPFSLFRFPFLFLYLSIYLFFIFIISLRFPGALCIVEAPWSAAAPATGKSIVESRFSDTMSFRRSIPVQTFAVRVHDVLLTLFHYR